MSNLLIIVLLVAAGVVAFLFYKRRSSTAPTSRQPALRLKGTGKYEHAVIGTARFRSALGEICEGTQRDAKKVEAILVPDDGGRGRTSVRVDIEGHTVGYLPTDLAEAYRVRLVESGYPEARGICSAQVISRLQSVGGDPDYAVRLDLPQKRSSSASAAPPR